jgi:hypothetical protein
MRSPVLFSFDGRKLFDQTPKLILRCWDDVMFSIFSSSEVEEFQVWWITADGMIWLGVAVVDFSGFVIVVVGQVEGLHVCCFGLVQQLWQISTGFRCSVLLWSLLEIQLYSLTRILVASRVRGQIRFDWFLPTCELLMRPNDDHGSSISYDQ